MQNASTQVFYSKGVTHDITINPELLANESIPIAVKKSSKKELHSPKIFKNSNCYRISFGAIKFTKTAKKRIHSNSLRTDSYSVSGTSQAKTMQALTSRGTAVNEMYINNQISRSHQKSSANLQ